MFARCRISSHYVANVNTPPRMRQCLYGFPDAAKFWQQVNCAKKNLLNISVCLLVELKRIFVSMIIIILSQSLTRD